MELQGLIQRILETRLLIRNDTLEKWQSIDPVLGKGEPGIILSEEDGAPELRIGNGVKKFSELKGIGLSPELASALQDGLMSKEDYAKLAAISAGATKVAASDTNGNLLVNDQEVTVYTLPESLPLSMISGAGDAAAKNVGTTVGSVVGVGEDGKIDSSLIPAMAITDTFPVDSEEAMLALAAQPGDIAIRSDISSTLILIQEPASTLANWVPISTPTAGVLSINGRTGVVVLTTDDIAETNDHLYYTEERAKNAAKSLSVTELSDGANVVFSTDVLILDCGGAAGITTPEVTPEEG